MNSADLSLILNILGVISFSISGVLVAARKKMDYLGVVILGIVSSVGGGVIRDIIMGRIPPTMFTNPLYVAVSFATSNLAFLYLYFNLDGKSRPAINRLFEEVYFWFDTIGLALFTTQGVVAGKALGGASVFLCSFLGVITGVGGGVLRDILADTVPAIFIKHIYALASIIGALVISLLWEVNDTLAMFAGSLLIIQIRYMARKHKWNLPFIKNAPVEH